MLVRLRAAAPMAAALAMTVGGAYLIALWMVGTVLMLSGLLWAADAYYGRWLARSDDSDLSGPKAIFRRYQRSP